MLIIKNIINSLNSTQNGTHQISLKKYSLLNCKKVNLHSFKRHLELTQCRGVGRGVDEDVYNAGVRAVRWMRIEDVTLSLNASTLL